MNPKPAGTRERKRAITIGPPHQLQQPSTAWRPSAGVLSAVRDRFRQSSEVPIPAELASEILSILPFPDIIAQLNGSGGTTAPEEMPLLNLELRIDDARLDGLYATLCSWALLSPTQPVVTASSRATAQALSGPLASDCGLEVTNAAKAGAGAGSRFRIQARVGDVFHPLLRSVLRRLRAEVAGLSWAALAIGGQPGQDASVWRLHPSLPVDPVIAAGGMAPVAYARRGTLAAHTGEGPGSAGAWQSAVMVPACLSARYCGATFDFRKFVEGIKIPAATETPPSITVVIAGGEAAAIETTLGSLAAQITARDIELILVLNESQGGQTDDLRQRRLEVFPGARILTCPAVAPPSARWNRALNASTAEVLIPIVPGVTFASNTGLEALARWAAIPGIGFVAAQTVTAPEPSDAAAEWEPAQASVEHGGAEPWPLPATVPYEPLCCWAISREAWRASGGFNELPGLTMFDVEFGVRLARQGYQNLVAGASVGIIARRRRADAVSIWLLRALYPGIDGLGLQRSHFEPAPRLSFADGRARYLERADAPGRFEGPRADFLAGLLLEERRRSISQRSEILASLAAVAPELAALEDIIADLRRCLESIEAAEPQLDPPAAAL